MATWSVATPPASYGEVDDGQLVRHVHVRTAFLMSSKDADVLVCVSILAVNQDGRPEG
jgi:hypothetical protein